MNLEPGLVILNILLMFADSAPQRATIADSNADTNIHVQAYGTVRARSHVKRLLFAISTFSIAPRSKQLPHVHHSGAGTNQAQEC